jgi:hypothetical protein
VPEIVTANRLGDGVVVYLTKDGGWSDDIAQATVAETKDDAQALLEQAQISVRERTVIAVYEMDVAVENGAPRPLSVREKIRAQHATTLTKDGYVQI